MLPSRKGRRAEQEAQPALCPGFPNAGHEADLNWKEARQKTSCFPRGVFGMDELFEENSLCGQNLTCLHEFEGKVVTLRGSKSKEKD